MVVEAAASDAAVVTGARATWRHRGGSVFRKLILNNIEQYLLVSLISFTLNNIK